MKRLCLILVFPLIHRYLLRVAAFVPSLRDVTSTRHPRATICSPSTFLLAQSSSSSSKNKGANTMVRDIMMLIESRYGSDVDWQRTKMYVYRAKNLSVSSVTQVLDFLDSFLSAQVVLALLKHSPRVLNKPVQSYLKPTAEFLMELWGPELFEHAMERRPQLLLTSGVGYNQQNTLLVEGRKQQNVEEVLTETIDLPVKELQQLKREDPSVFGLRAEKVKEVLEYLNKILEPTAKGKPILRKMVVGYPSVLHLSVETNLEPRVKFLTEKLQLTPQELAKIIQTGAILGLSIDANLRPTLKYLQEDLLLGENLKKCILSHPQLLALSLANIQGKSQFFRSIGPSLAPRIARRCPAIFSLNLDTNIAPTLDFLSRVWGCRWDDAAMEAWLAEYPNVLTLSIEGNLQPTMNFFNRTGYTSLDDSWKLAEGGKRIRGRYIASSLFHRLLPRWHYCVNHELPPPPLHVIVTASDVAFCQQLSLDVDDFLMFRNKAVPRLKFSSQFDTWLKTGRPIDLP